MENKEMDNMYPRQNTVAAGQYSQRNEEVDEAGQYRKKLCTVSAAKRMTPSHIQPPSMLEGRLFAPTSGSACSSISREFSSCFSRHSDDTVASTASNEPQTPVTSDDDQDMLVTLYEAKKETDHRGIHFDAAALKRCESTTGEGDPGAIFPNVPTSQLSYPIKPRFPVFEKSALSVSAKREQGVSEPFNGRTAKHVPLDDQVTLFSAIRNVLSPDVAGEVIQSFEEVPLSQRYTDFLRNFANNAAYAGYGSGSADASNMAMASSSGVCDARGRSSRKLPQKDDESRKRGRSTGDDGDKNGKRPSKQIQKTGVTPNLLWRCPFNMAFPGIRSLDKRFQSCTSEWTPRCELTDHLSRVHMWHPKKDGDRLPKFDPYLISQDQYKVIDVKRKEAPRVRPVGSTKWFKAQEDFFSEMWQIIFPRDRYPDLEQPEDPFRRHSHKIPRNLKFLLCICQEKIHLVRAGFEVAAGRIDSVDNYVPTKEQISLEWKDAIAIASQVYELQPNFSTIPEAQLRDAIARQLHRATPQPENEPVAGPSTQQLLPESEPIAGPSTQQLLPESEPIAGPSTQQLLSGGEFITEPAATPQAPENIGDSDLLYTAALFDNDVAYDWNAFPNMGEDDLFGGISE